MMIRYFRCVCYFTGNGCSRKPEVSSKSSRTKKERKIHENWHCNRRKDFQLSVTVIYKYWMTSYISPPVLKPTIYLYNTNIRPLFYNIPDAFWRDGRSHGNESFFLPGLEYEMTCQSGWVEEGIFESPCLFSTLSCCSNRNIFFSLSILESYFAKQTSKWLSSLHHRHWDAAVFISGKKTLKIFLVFFFRRRKTTERRYM